MAEALLIAGPTASGKSALALALAERWGAEIVNADSMQLYADLSVLTARPSAEDLARAPHHLYGVADAAEAWSTGRWLRAAERVIADITARGARALVVGGTGLYFKALTQGLSEIPAPAAGAREKAAALYAAEGAEGLRRAAQALDPDAAAGVLGDDRQRLGRILEVGWGTEKTLTAWRADIAAPVLAPGRWRGVVLEGETAALDARIGVRARAMLKTGGVAEAAALLARGLDPELPAMKALGVADVAAHLRGETDLEATAAAITLATRRYAKRQRTWFRNQHPDWPRAQMGDVEAAARALAAPAG